MKSFLNSIYIVRIVSSYKNIYKDFLKFCNKSNNNTNVLDSNKGLNKNKPKIEYK